MELIYRDDAYCKTCEAVVVSADDQGIRLDRTVFYPTGGGQPGDSGVLRLADGGTIRIVEARKGADHEDVVHVPEPGTALPAPGTKLTAEIDWDRRYRHMRIHSCLHLLCAVIDGDVTGGQIGDGKGRLDFNLPDTRLDKAEIAVNLNRLIAEDHPVGMELKGQIVRYQDAGLVVDLGDDLEGMVQQSQLPLAEGKSVEEETQLGQMVALKVLEVDPIHHRIVLAATDFLEVPEGAQERIAARAAMIESAERDEDDKGVTDVTTAKVGGAEDGAGIEAAADDAPAAETDSPVSDSGGSDEETKPAADDVPAAETDSPVSDSGESDEETKPAE